MISFKVVPARTAALPAAVLALSAMACAAPAAMDCAGLVGLKLANAAIASAQAVPAGAFTPPGRAESRIPVPYTALPAFCRVAGIITPAADSTIQFEVWLPAAGWNRKLQGVGNGGFAGSMPYSSFGLPLSRGYAVAGTDTGHTGIDAAWAVGHPAKVIDFGYRAIHETAVQAKAIIRAFYGADPAHSYFSSCSNGGRQGLMEAQRYPQDYDGIIAGAPANNWVHHFAGFVWDLKALTEPGAYIPSKKLPAIEQAALAACDRSDGVSDGVIDRPTACRFDPAVLLCKGAESDACLTEPQVAALKRIYAGPRNSKGEQLFPGYLPGGETGGGGWAMWITGATATLSLQALFGTQFFSNMVMENSAWKYQTFDIDTDVKTADDKLAGVLTATDPNLKAFHARGGKLILYHGWSDAAIAPQNTIDYYLNVAKTVGQRDTDRFVRLFMVPGMQHCSDGPGTCSFGQLEAGPQNDPDHDISLALERWVEKGTAPEIIIAAGTANATGSKRTRPLCAYPKVARWKGAGSTDDAANFTCVNQPAR
jgi:hypothetical protein